MKKTRKAALTDALLETADDMRRTGILTQQAHAKITKRHLGEDAGVARPVSANDIRVMRKRSRMSQAVFARYLNVSTGYVSHLERGTKEPAGPTLVLLNIIQRKGIEALL
ncbi:MAG TPA: helix-turn-helix domain-containing protein [Rhizomicrobium sp.]|jgi:putative transcriptional regulator